MTQSANSYFIKAVVVAFIRLFLVHIIVFMCVPFASAQQISLAEFKGSHIFNFDQKNSGELITGNMIYLESDQYRYEPFKLLNNTALLWTQENDPLIQKDSAEKAMWFYGQVHVLVDQLEPILLTAHYPMLEFLDVYVIEHGKVVAQFFEGAGIPFEERTIKNRNFVFPVPMLQGHTYEILIRVQTSNQLLFSSNLYTRNEFLKRERAEILMHFILFGGVFVLLA